jgi:hypothetical protein
MAGITTNCGIITPQSYEDIVCSIPGVGITHNNLPYFHHMLCQWAYNIPLNFQWVLVIEAVNKDYLMEQIKNMVPAFEPGKWNMSKTADETWTKQTQDTIGCIFAQGVELPGETSVVERAGMPDGSNRGFIKAPIINGRQDFTDLNITFLETNRSFVEGVIRPWNIVVNHRGLVARGDAESIKSRIQVYELAKAGACTPNIIRKHWTFHDAVPTMISSEQKSQETSSDYGKRQTAFTFNSYHIDDMNTQSPASPDNNNNNNLPLYNINTIPNPNNPPTFPTQSIA